jgi:hypothetical protein
MEQQKGVYFELVGFLWFWVLPLKGGISFHFAHHFFHEFFCEPAKKSKKIKLRSSFEKYCSSRAFLRSLRSEKKREEAEGITENWHLGINLMYLVANISLVCICSTCNFRLFYKNWIARVFDLALSPFRKLELRINYNNSVLALTLVWYPWRNGWLQLERTQEDQSDFWRRETPPRPVSQALKEVRKRKNRRNIRVPSTRLWAELIENGVWGKN